MIVTKTFDTNSSDGTRQKIVVVQTHNPLTGKWDILHETLIDNIPLGTELYFKTY